jgi:hypothetical protein
MNDHPAISGVASYGRYLTDRLCWLDGTPTHASSDQQRQCPKCRLKWSYERLALELSLLREYSIGRSASEAARQAGCVKNTALHHYGNFRFSMENLVMNLLLDGSIATNPLNARELKSLEKALRSGSRRQREKSCRHLFLCSLNFEERIEALFQSLIVPAVQRRAKEAAERLETPETAPWTDIRYAAPWRGLDRHRIQPKQSPAAPTHFWNAFFREVRARLDPNCPYPSSACKKLGTQWVQVWEKARDIRRGRNRVSPP